MSVVSVVTPDKDARRDTAPRAGGIELLVMRPAALPARAGAVDALRGLAILGMVLVAAEPIGVLPAWMYHAQEPPPAHEMNVNLPGLTWPDLVFPFFIFTLGVAIPLALARRLERGGGYGEILRGVVSRGVLLIFFALFRQHFDSLIAEIQPETSRWIIGLVAFAILFAIFVRFPDGWSRARRLGARAVGWAAALLMFALIRFPDGSRFKPERIDIILLILAYCAVFGTLVWLVTRRNILVRLAVLALVASFRLVGYNPGWLNTVYEYDPIPWLYSFSMFQFLCVVIPGTIVGDMLLDWMRTPPRHGAGTLRHGSWSRARTMVLAGGLLLFVPLVLVGIQSRHVFTTTMIAALLCAFVFSLARHPRTPTESLIAQLIHWGAFWLLLGLIMDPLDGGTKKVPETFAWFFQGAGLAIFVMVVFIIIMDVLQKPRWLQLLIDNGQNPMIAYVGYGMLVLPLLGLTTVKDAIESSEPPPWNAFGFSIIATLLVAVIVRFFTRRKLFWRS